MSLMLADVVANAVVVVCGRAERSSNPLRTLQRFEVCGAVYCFLVDEVRAYGLKFVDQYLNKRKTRIRGLDNGLITSWRGLDEYYKSCFSASLNIPSMR
jgi:hypothetical protein